MQKPLVVVTTVFMTVFMMAGLALGPALAETKPAGKPAWHGQHTMTGTVTAVDYATGVLSLNTHEGELKLHFPPTTVKEVKTGDTLTVSLGFHEGVGTAMGSH